MAWFECNHMEIFSLMQKWSFWSKLKNYQTNCCKGTWCKREKGSCVSISWISVLNFLFPLLCLLFYPDKAIQLGALLSPKWERSQAGLEASPQTEIEDAWEENTRSNTGSDQCTVVKLGMTFSNLPKTVRPQQIKRPTFLPLLNCYSLQFHQTAAL